MAVAVVVIVAPGPDFALVVHTTLARGRRGGVATALGVVSGQLVWELASIAGVTALLVASHPAFVAIRIAGAAYLVWLGLHALWSAWRGARVAVVRTRASGYRQGLLSNVGNPKMAIFFTSLLPQFGAGALSLLAHGLAFSLLTLAWLALVVRVGDALRVPRVRRAIDAITGIVLVALGVRVATARR